MNDDFEFLEYIYQNARVGQEIIGRVLNHGNITNELQEKLKYINQNYKKIANSAKLMIQRRKKEVKDISILSKMATYLSVKKYLEEGGKVEDIINMFIQNISNGIEEIAVKMNDYKLKSKTIINLGSRFMDIEHENLEKIKEQI